MQTYESLLLVTARLTLRPLLPADAPALYAIFSDPVVARHLSHREWTDLAEAEREIAIQRADLRSASAVKLGVVINATGELAGTVKLYHVMASSRRCEVGYALGTAWWGQGYLTEALEALFDFAFHSMDINRIEADIDPVNTASARALERLGFMHEGVLRQRWIVAGEVSDTAMYGLLRSDWDARASRPRQ